MRRIPGRQSVLKPPVVTVGTSFIPRLALRSNVRCDRLDQREQDYREDEESATQR